MKNYIAIDTENVGRILNDLSWIETIKDSYVIVFYSEHNKSASIFYEALYLLQQSNEVIFKKAYGPPQKNALDFQIVAFLTSIIVTKKQEEISVSIVSNDKGYESFQAYSEACFGQEIKLVNYGCTNIESTEIKNAPSVSKVSVTKKTKSSTSTQNSNQYLINTKENIDKQHEILKSKTLPLTKVSRDSILCHCRVAYTKPANEREEYIIKGLTKSFCEKTATKLFNEYVKPYALCLPK